MASKAQCIFIDQDFYGAVRFFGAVTFKSTGSFIAKTITAERLVLSGDAVVTGDITANDVTANDVTAGGFLSGILKTYATDTVSNPPTSAELNGIFGDPTANAGVIRMIYDGATAKTYLCVCNGTLWTYTALTDTV